MQLTQIKPLVSIVIPVYNGSNFMKEAIDSAIAQTYPNIEILVVNDGSDDNGATKAIAESYGDSIRYFEKENGGCASALNCGIERMRGTYFSWLSHDDVYLPEKIEHQMLLLAGIENKDTIIYGGWEIINAESEVITVVYPHNAQPSEKLDISLFPLLRGLLHGCSMLIPTRYFREIAVFDVTLPTTQDYSLWFKFLKVAPIHYDPHVLIKSRVHPEQGTHKIKTHIEECNDLWCGFLTKLTQAEMTEMEGSPYQFLKKTEQFLDKTPYRVAQKMSKQMAQASLAKTLISVIIPFHNRIEWTIEAIKSALAQTHKHLEIILVDDGSTDDINVLLNLAKSDTRVTYIYQEQAGAAKARNVGVAHAKGVYIAFLDSDDLFASNKLERQLAYMEAEGLEICHTSYERIDTTGKFICSMPTGKFAGNVYPRIIESCTLAMPTVMGRAEIFKRHAFPEYLRIGEDVCLWIKITSIFKLGGLDEPLSQVRVSPDSSSMDNQKQLIGRIGIASYVLMDPELSGYSEHLKILLKGTITLIATDDEKPEQFHQESRKETRPRLMLQGLSYLRRNGLRATVRRALLQLGL